MTSASTKRRHQRNATSVRKSAANLHRFANTWLDGVDSNIRHKRQAAARAHVTVVRNALADLPGLIEDAIASGTPHGNAEIQHLRAAMVHAMDECESALRSKTLRGVALTSVTDAHSLLKTALEKK
jgi:hypothetical protein